MIEVRLRRALASGICAALALCATVLAKAPETTSYQGRITDAVGDPVPDGNYTVDFHLYNDPVAGILLWEELGVIITTTNGLFTTVLGTPTPFPQNSGSVVSASPFVTGDTLWLEIVVEGETQTPRTRLESAPFAQSARDLSGWATNGTGVGLRSNAQTGSISTYGFSSEERVRIWGPNWGEIFLWGSEVDPQAVISAGSGFGGYLTLSDPDFVGNEIELNTGLSGDASVQVPLSSINALETLNEPGIAHSRMTVPVNLTPSNVSQDITSISITIPSSGYIVLDGYCYLSTFGTGAAFTWVQISENSDAARVSGHYTWNGESDSEAETIYYTAPVRRVYSKGAGTYTFYLQGNLYESNDVGVNGSAWAPSWLLATFYPTAYGTVSTVADQPGDHPEATGFSLSDPLTNETTTVYSLDLRYYELRAQEAELAALKAQRELDNARRRAATNAGTQVTETKGQQ